MTDPIAALIEADKQLRGDYSRASEIELLKKLIAAMPAIVEMVERVAFLENELADVADVRAGNGPTALSAVMADNERLRAELAECRRSKDHAVDLLIGIHSLLYPAPIKAPDGRTMVFRPKSIDPHEVLQELSDRIRALPDALAQQKGKEEST